MSKFNGIIKSVYINKFRRFNEILIPLSPKITIIAGQNGTLKSTLLGLIGQPFSFKKNNDDATDFYEEKTLEGLAFQGQLSEKFKLGGSDKPGDHLWHLTFSDPNFFGRDSFEVESIWRNQTNKSIRFWSTEGRGKGQGYLRLPVIFLSLKRLSPIGEENKINISETLFTQEETNIFSREHNTILSLNDTIKGFDYISSTHKKTAGPRIENIDSTAISSGQDNIGKIILALLSFKRLKEKYPSTYKGGLLLIDEIDATLFPSAQLKLLERLLYWSGKLEVQIICTTHSPTIIMELYNQKYKYNSSVVYLSRIGSNIQATINPPLERINADLTLKPLLPKKSTKIRVYTEDKEAIQFAKNLLGRKANDYEFISVSMGADDYINLIKKRRVPEFVNSLILLDGDKLEQTPKLKNVICLPGGDNNSGPDKLLYDFLSELPANDKFWPAGSNIDNLGEYSKQFCFKDFPKETLINKTDRKPRDIYKEWYRSQLPYWGSNSATKAYTRWKQDHSQEVSSFLEDFEKASSHVKGLK